MKIVITGASGLLGRDVWKTLELTHELIGLGRQKPGFVSPLQWRECNLTQHPQTYDTVSRDNPDVVVHCAAFSNVDECERDPEKAYQQNALATRNLALACQRFDSALLLISTDYVFGGGNASPDGYREFDKTGPVNVYGQSKKTAEEIVKHLLGKFFIVRTSWLFGPARPTFIDKVTSSAMRGQKVPALTDLKSSPTYSADLAKALAILIASQRYGVYHLSNAGFCTRAELAEYVLDQQKLPRSVLQIMRQADLGLPAPRPHFSGLQNWMWALDGFPKMRPWQEALKDYLQSKKAVAL